MTDCATQITQLFSQKREIVQGKVIQVYFLQTTVDETARTDSLLNVVVNSFNGIILNRPPSPGSKRRDYDVKFANLEVAKAFCEYLKKKNLRTCKIHNRILTDNGSFQAKPELETFDKDVQMVIQENCHNKQNL